MHFRKKFSKLCLNVIFRFGELYSMASAAAANSNLLVIFYSCVPLSPFPPALADSSSQNGFLGFPFELSDENVVAACTVGNMDEAGEGIDEAAPKLSELSEDGASCSIKDLFRISP